MKANILKATILKTMLLGLVIGDMGCQSVTIGIQLGEGGPAITVATPGIGGDDVANPLAAGDLTADADLEGILDSNLSLDPVDSGDDSTEDDTEFTGDDSDDTRDDAGGNDSSPETDGEDSQDADDDLMTAEAPEAPGVDVADV